MLDGSAAQLRGSVDDLDTLHTGAAQADGVVHMAIAGDFSNPEDITSREVAAIQALGQALVDTDKPLVTTSGTLVLPAGHLTTEHDTPDPNSIGSLRIPGAQACLDFADRGVRAVVLRLAPTVHGPRDHGFIPMLISAARASGVSAYIEDGSNRWPAVHRLDAANLYRLALEKAPAGETLHATGEQAISFRSIAEKIGEKLNLPTKSVAATDAAAHFGNPFMAVVFSTDAPVSSEHTQQLLGWSPNDWTLLEDLDNGDYFANPAPA